MMGEGLHGWGERTGALVPCLGSQSAIRCHRFVITGKLFRREEPPSFLTQKKEGGKGAQAYDPPMWRSRRSGQVDETVPMCSRMEAAASARSEASSQEA